MNSKLTEAELRDKLAAQLHLLEDGLELLDKERHIPNHIGTKGFIDILAKDSHGHFVIIELKRCNSTAREALHEVLKYIEGIKQHLSARENEIKIFVVSTEWDELLVPFSSFVNRIDCTVRGFELKYSQGTKTLQARLVEPLRLQNERLFVKEHTFYLYTSQANLDKGVNSITSSLKSKGITDYALLILTAPEGLRERTIESIIQSTRQINEVWGFERDQEREQRIRDTQPNYQFMAYLAIQQLSKESFLELIKRDEKLYERMADELTSGAEEENIIFLQNCLLDDMDPKPFFEGGDMSYAAKLGTTILETEGWKITEVIRSGGLSRNQLLSDETIVNELLGTSGVTRQKYRNSFDSSHPGNLAQITKDVNRCLQDNSVWRIHIRNIIEEIRELPEGKAFSGHIQIFNPSNILLTVVQAVTNEEPKNWIPCYFVRLYLEGEERIYFSSIEHSGKKPSANEILNKYYNSRTLEMVWPLNWGGYENRDLQIMRDLGLEYVSYLVVKKEGSVEFFKYVDFSFEKTDTRIDCYIGFMDFLEKEQEFVEEVWEIFDKHLVGGMIMSSKEPLEDDTTSSQ